MLKQDFRPLQRDGPKHRAADAKLKSDTLLEHLGADIDRGIHPVIDDYGVLGRVMGVGEPEESEEWNGCENEDGARGQDEQSHFSKLSLPGLLRWELLDLGGAHIFLV